MVARAALPALLVRNPTTRSSRVMSRATRRSYPVGCEAAEPRRWRAQAHPVTRPPNGNIEACARSWLAGRRCRGCGDGVRGIHGTAGTTRAAYHTAVDARGDREVPAGAPVCERPIGDRQLFADREGFLGPSSLQQHVRRTVLERVQIETVVARCVRH